MDVKDSCCLLSPPTIPPSHLLRLQPSSMDLKYIMSQDSMIKIFLWAVMQTLDLAVWIVEFNKNLPQPEWMCCGKLWRTYPSHVKLQDQAPRYLRCQKTIASHSLLLVDAKWKKRVSNIKHFQMLKLMFYLKMTMLMLSLMLLLFCLFIA